ncbi:MAG: aldehyde dehydrogenase family protein, partial [Burkholderiaceae bacterium]|nr:aldehyde dehydrogenase family protein [Burkholderiaceae bacterium]
MTDYPSQRMNTHSHSYPSLGQYINGEWLYDANNGVLEVVDPATERQLALLPKAGTYHIEGALTAARAANIAWRETPVEKRAAYLHAAAELLRERAATIAAVITLEQGKPLKEALDEVGRSAQIIDWNAQAAIDLLQDDKVWSEGTSLTTLSPIGPVAAFTPWNVPLLSPARKISMSLAAGCPCILKPAEDTPGSAIELVRAFADAGLPAGVLNLLLGDPSHISDALIRSPTIRKVTFTGSVPVGKHIAA